MTSFVLDRWTIDGSTLEARFTQGPGDAPVAYVNVEGLEDAPEVEAYFAGLAPFNEEIALVESPGEISIQGEYTDPLALRGARVHSHRRNPRSTLEHL